MLLQLTVCVIVVFLHCDVNKCDLYNGFYLFLSLSEKAKITDSFRLNGNDKVCKEVCYRIITISHFFKYVIVRFIIELY